MHSLDQALAFAERASEVEADQAVYFQQLGCIRTCRGEYDQALNLAERAFEVDPYHPTNLIFAGYILCLAISPCCVVSRPTSDSPSMNCSSIVRIGNETMKSSQLS